jgi:hypothetical protein
VISRVLIACFAIKMYLFGLFAMLRFYSFIMGVPAVHTFITR